ncbi:MAG: GGDEF domain-containing protein [Gemmatimonadaceae bacterium]|nr:GGDEF domain-containing protein [Gemmatimonadaceae bacterium]
MVTLATVVLVVTVAAAASAATLALSRRRSRGSIEPDDAVQPATRSLETYGPGRLLRTTIEQALPSHLSRKHLEQVEQVESDSDRVILERFLADVRDLVAADEAVFWVWVEDRDALRPWAWSTPSVERPQHFRMGDWGPLVQWSAQERLMHTAGADPAFPQLAVAPVMAGDRLHGVVSVTSAAGLSIGKVAVRQWLPRHADHVAKLAFLFETRRGYSQHMRQGQALLRAADQIRAHKSPETLAQALCMTALEVTSASEAALVRWDASSGTGEVQYASSSLGVGAGFNVAPDSLVARTCVDGLPIVLEDASTLLRNEVFGPGDGFTRAGSAAVIPIVRDDVCLGALVIAAVEEGAISNDEARNVGLLGAIGIAALELVWGIEEVDRRARIDSLTGLSNRRAFEEHLQRIIAETDRFGGCGSLVLVDLDHFKSVNDTYGHQAGDQVLRQVARALTDGVRTVDVCARYGGEELAILLPQTGIDGARDLAERLRVAIADKVVRVNGEEIRVTASFGVASYPDPVKVKESLFPAADRALYAAKHDGRNCVRSAGVSHESA